MGLAGGLATNGGLPTAPVSLHPNGAFTPEVVPGLAFTNLAATANRAYFGRFVAPRAMTATGVTFGVGTAAGSNDNCDVGIYNSTLTTALATAGTTAGKLNALGVQTVNFSASASLVAGTVYYAVFAAGPIGTTAAQLRAASLNTNDLSQLAGTAEPNLIQGTQTITLPLSGSQAGMTAGFTQPVLFVLG